MPGNQPPEIQAIIDEVLRKYPFASVAEINRQLAARMQGYNDRPQAELGGLSPTHMSQLLYGDWLTGAFRLTDTLSLEELEPAAILADARTLLSYVAEKGPVKETPAKNLTRAAVADLLPRLRIHAEAVEDNAYWRGPRNEDDVRMLSTLRHTLMFAGLLQRRKGLRITPRGRALLEAEQAGALYLQLFLTFFRTLDLRVLDMTDRHPGLQATLPFSFHQLRTHAREWASAEALAMTCWLESAKEPPTRSDEEFGDFRYFTFLFRVLRPLGHFGLLESRESAGADGSPRSTEFRLTPLFDRFMRFEFTGGRPHR